jgi:hypothetical protein
VEELFEGDVTNGEVITRFRRCFLRPPAVHIPWRRSGPSPTTVQRVQRSDSPVELWLPTTHLLAFFLGEWVALFMLHVLLEIEECVEENRRHFASLQVRERDAIALYRLDHVEHLEIDQ